MCRLVLAMINLLRKCDNVNSPFMKCNCGGTIISVFNVSGTYFDQMFQYFEESS